MRAKDLSAVEGDRRRTLQIREDELASLRAEIEHLKILNGKQIEDQYELKNEVEALKRHVALLNQ